MLKILAIMGSPRLNGNTNYLTDQVLEVIASRDIETEKVALCQYKIGPCLGHENCSSFKVCAQQDDAAAILQKFLTADGLIISSPVYYFNVSGQMKTFIDRNYFLFRHGLKSKARAAGLIAVAGGGGMDDVIRYLKKYLELPTSIDSGEIFTVTGTARNPGQAKNEPGLTTAAREMGQRLADCLLSFEQH